MISSGSNTISSAIRDNAAHHHAVHRHSISPLPLKPGNAANIGNMRFDVGKDVANAIPLASGARQLLSELERHTPASFARLAPAELGRVMRQFDQVTGVRHSLLPTIDLNPFDDIVDAIKDKIIDTANAVKGATEAIFGAAKDGLESLYRSAQDLVDGLVSLPPIVAERIANSLRGPAARELTSTERASLEEVFGDEIDLDNVRIVRGSGYNAAAAAAFQNGNPAITIGDTVYVRPDVYDRLGSDFTSSPEGIETLAHEFTHVMQYQKLGFGDFFARYGNEFARAGGDADKLYDYESRPETVYATETLEGQAQMVGDYARYLAGDQNITPEQARDIENRLNGTGIFGL